MKEFEEILSEIIRHLEQLKESGVERVEVSRETLAELAVLPPLPPPARPSPESDAIQALKTKIKDSTKAAALYKIWERARACMLCAELAAQRTHVVLGAGDPDARLVFVGEAPGEDEDIQGEPFVGKAGQLLTKIIQAMGLKRSDVYIANVLKCRPPGNRKPSPEEMVRCLPFLKEQLEIIQPEVIVALGNVAVEGLFGLTGITKLRGQWLTYKLTSGREIPTMPTYHPSYLLRDPNQKRYVWEDVQKVMEKLGLERPSTSSKRD